MVLRVRSAGQRKKNARGTITAAGEHNPAKRQVGQLPFVGTIRVRCRTALFLRGSRGQGAITLSQPLVAPPAGFLSLGPGREDCK